MHIKFLVGLVAIVFVFVTTSNSRVFAQVQDPMALDILDKVAAKYKGYSTWGASFNRVLTSASDKLLSKNVGSIIVNGKSFKLSLKDQIVFCNGSLIYTLSKTSKEVTLNDYEPEADDITPTEIFNLYQRGYKYVYMGDVKVKNQMLQVVDLEPIDRKKPVTKVRLMVGKLDKVVKKWVVTERGSNNKQVFEVIKFSPNVVTATSDFTFNIKLYPGYKLVDMR